MRRLVILATLALGGCATTFGPFGAPQLRKKETQAKGAALAATQGFALGVAFIAFAYLTDRFGIANDEVYPEERYKVRIGHLVELLALGVFGTSYAVGVYDARSDLPPEKAEKLPRVEIIPHTHGRASRLPPSSYTKAPLLAAIERGGCFGNCPIYTVAIFRDGHVEFEGIKDVETIGKASDIAPQGALDALDRLLADTMGLVGDVYDAHDCTDLPGVRIWYQPRGKELISIGHYQGDRRAPKELFEAENAIDRLSDSTRWIGAHPGGPMGSHCR